MFLKAFKVKSNEKYLNKLLSQRKVNVDDAKIKSLGILLDFDEIDNFNVFNPLASQLKLHSNTIKAIGYTGNVKSQGNSWDVCFNETDFGWKGIVKNVELQTFINTPFDMLLSFYDKPVQELKLITAKSISKFKVGILQTDERLNDLIIKTSVKEVDVFCNELVKYLNVLHKI